MDNIFETIIGTYQPYYNTETVVKDVDGETVTIVSTSVPDGISGVDVPWVCNATLIIIVIAMFFRLLGSLICRK